MRVKFFLLIILLLPTRGVSGNGSYTCFSGTDEIDTGYQVMTTDVSGGTANLAVVNVTSSSVAANYSLLWSYTELNSNNFSESNQSSISVPMRLFQNNMSGLIWRLQVYSSGDMQVCVSHRFSFTFVITHVFIPLTGSTVEGESMPDYGWLWFAAGVGVIACLIIIRRWKR